MVTSYQLPVRAKGVVSFVDVSPAIWANIAIDSVYRTHSFDVRVNGSTYSLNFTCHSNGRVCDCNGRIFFHIGILTNSLVNVKNSS